MNKACRVFMILFFVVCATVLVGCVTIPKTGDLKDSLRNESEKYWKLRMEDKYEETYSMEDRQGLRPFQEYREIVAAMKKINISSYAVKEVKVDGDKGEVAIEFAFTLPRMPKPVTQVVVDPWVYKDWKWRHLLVPVQGTNSSGVSSTNK